MVKKVQLRSWWRKLFWMIMTSDKWSIYDCWGAWSKPIQILNAPKSGPGYLLKSLMVLENIIVKINIIKDEREDEMWWKEDEIAWFLERLEWISSWNSGIRWEIHKKHSDVAPPPGKGALGIQHWQQWCNHSCNDQDIVKDDRNLVFCSSGASYSLEYVYTY